MAAAKQPFTVCAAASCYIFCCQFLSIFKIPGERWLLSVVWHLFSAGKLRSSYIQWWRAAVQPGILLLLLPQPLFCGRHYTGQPALAGRHPHFRTGWFWDVVGVVFAAHLPLLNDYMSVLLYNVTRQPALWPLYALTCVSRHLQLRTGGFLLVQSFTAHMLLLTATSTFQLGRYAGVLLNGVIYTVSISCVSIPCDSLNKLICDQCILELS